MHARNALFAAFAGFASFMLATVTVTALLESRVEFSVLVGLPVGIVVGLLVLWFVYTRLTEPGPAGRRAATAIVAGAAGFVLGLSLPATFGAGLTMALVIAIAAGFIAALVSYTQRVTVE